MKLVKTASGKQTVKMSKAEWQSIGKAAGWNDDESPLEVGWNKFNDFVGFGTWDEEVEADMGDPTPEERSSIEQLGYYGKEITEESIAGLKARKAYQEGLKVTRNGIDGPDSASFESKEEMKKYIEERLSSDARNVTEDGFGTDYSNYHLEGATMSELGIVVKTQADEEKEMNDAISRQESYDLIDKERLY